MPVSVKCLKCGGTRFIELCNLTKIAKYSYDQIAWLICFDCGEDLPMSRKPTVSIGNIQFGSDAILDE